jgi:dissimilatory sulfite reductase (desulfoviridin) alpha/beta subunit
LYSFGFYFSAISIARDDSLRHNIREFAKKESRLLDSIGRAQEEQEIQRLISKVYKVVREQEHALKEQTVIDPSIDKQDMENYVEEVLKEVTEMRKRNHK